MNYTRALGFLTSLIDYERWIYRNYEFKLDNYVDFLTTIGNPHRKLRRVVLIAGTKGKGSTAAMLAKILKAHGEKVGLYTSPHLIDYTERIRVDGRKISKKSFTELLEGLKPAIESHEPHLTFFEAMSTVAFCHFLAQETTVNVLEVGLGGRLDATNVTDPVISVITRIGYDHTQTLGRTLRQITGEKCGILREKGLAVISNQRPRVRAVITEELVQKKARGVWWGLDFKTGLIEESCQYLKGLYHSRTSEFEFSLPLLGRHQIENAATAIAATELLSANIDVEKTRRALSFLSLPSRIQKVSDAPTILVDMSHNPEAASTLRKTLDEHFVDRKRRILLIGTTRHKDKRGILEVLAPFFTEIWVTRANLPRAESIESLLKVCTRFHPNCRRVESVSQGIDRILNKSGKADLLVVTGSVYAAGEALGTLKTRP